MIVELVGMSCLSVATSCGNWSIVGSAGPRRPSRCCADKAGRFIPIRIPMTSNSTPMMTFFDMTLLLRGASFASLFSRFGCQLEGDCVDLPCDAVDETSHLLGGGLRSLQGRVEIGNALFDRFVRLGRPHLHEVPDPGPIGPERGERFPRS